LVTLVITGYDAEFKQHLQEVCDQEIRQFPNSLFIVNIRFCHSFVLHKLHKDSLFIGT
jgi:hypothetical protein